MLVILNKDWEDLLVGSINLQMKKIVAIQAKKRAGSLEKTLIKKIEELYNLLNKTKKQTNPQEFS